MKKQGWKRKNGGFKQNFLFKAFDTFLHFPSTFIYLNIEHSPQTIKTHSQTVTNIHHK